MTGDARFCDEFMRYAVCQMAGSGYGNSTRGNWPIVGGHGLNN